MEQDRNLDLYRVGRIGGGAVESDDGVRGMTAGDRDAVDQRAAPAEADDPRLAARSL